MKTDFTVEQKKLAIQRLTALWAFAESGLGGMLHAFHIPVTGLVLGSISVICISLIAGFSEKHSVEILKSLLIVLIVKAVVSPQTPFPAYIAVGFQGIAGFCFFSIARPNFLSILAVAILTMLESALQKLLLVALFFGGSLWKAIDEMVQFIGSPLGLETNTASMLIIGCYLFVYVNGGVLTAFVAFKLVKQSFQVNEEILFETGDAAIKHSVKGKNKKWIWIIAGLSILIFSGFYNGVGAAIFRPLVWTIAVITGWYFIIVPWVTTLLKKILLRTDNKYRAEALEIISFFPFIRHIVQKSWRATADRNAITRIPVFIMLVVTTLLSFQSPKLQDHK